jgi:ABC-type multidrug transport system fused ATPase/permease subunit
VFKHCKPLLFLILVSSSVYAFALIPIWLQKTYIDNLQAFLAGSYSFGALIFWLLLFYFTRVLSGGFLIPLAGAKDLYYEYTTTRHVRKSQHRINNSIKLENYDSQNVYNLMERSAQALTSGALRSTVNAVAASLTMLISFGSMLISLAVIHYSFLLYSVVLIGPSFLEYFWFQKRLYGIEKSLVETRRRQGFCLNHVTGKSYYLQTRISGSASYFINEWEKYREKTERLFNEVHRRKITFGAFSGIVKSGCITGMIFTGLSLLSGERISIGSFSSLVGIIGMLMGYMNFFISTLSQSIVRVSELKEACRYYEIPLEKREDSPISTIGDVTLENVSFKYESGEKDALTGITHTFRHGEKIAILGLNGAGKTTLTNIIMGLYTPHDGRVLYNGVDIADRDRTKWRQKFTAVFQDFQIYNITISDNVFLAYTREKKDLNALRASLELAGFPLDKYEPDTQIGRHFNGIELSRGEAQKLAAARSYYNSQAEIIVVDEPVSALDPLAEERLYQTFINNSGDKTLLIVSHHMASVKVVDRILVMDSSKILEEGTHEQLLKKNGVYSRMYKEQAALYARAAQNPLISEQP